MTQTGRKRGAGAGGWAEQGRRHGAETRTLSIRCAISSGRASASAASSAWGLGALGFDAFGLAAAGGSLSAEVPAAGAVPGGEESDCGVSIDAMWLHVLDKKRHQVKAARRAEGGDVCSPLVTHPLRPPAWAPWAWASASAALAGTAGRGPGQPRRRSCRRRLCAARFRRQR